MAVIARVANYVQFRDAFLKDEEKRELKADKAGYEVTKVDNETTYFLNRDDYVVITPSEKALKVFLDKKTEPLSARLTQPLLGKLRRGDLLAGFLLLYPLGRFFIEFIKLDAPDLPFTIGAWQPTIAQLVSLAFVIGSAVFLYVEKTEMATIPITSDVRVPYMMRERVSLPMASVPSQWAAPGAFRASSRFCS